MGEADEVKQMLERDFSEIEKSLRTGKLRSQDIPLHRVERRVEVLQGAINALATCVEKLEADKANRASNA